MNDPINHYAGVYLRYKDQFDNILPETIIELHEKVRQEFLYIPCEVKFVEEELNDYELLKHKLEEDGTLYVSTLHNESRLFPGHLNLMFRAWHDAVHFGNNLPFDYEGEVKTWELQSIGLSQQARQVLFSEIVLQTAYALHYGTFPKTQKVILI